MKKVVLFLLSIFVVGFIFNSSNISNIAYAQDLTICNNSCSVVLFGYGQYEVMANTAEIKVATVAKDEKSSVALESANAKMQDLQNALSESFSSIETDKCIEFMNPKINKDNVMYEYVKTCTFITNNTNEVEQITSKIKENDAVVLCVCYKTTELKSAYSNAIKNALEDAKQKAQGINPNLKVNTVLEENVLQTSSKNLNISVFAKVCVSFCCDECESLEEENKLEDNKELKDENNILEDDVAIKENSRKKVVEF